MPTFEMGFYTHHIALTVNSRACIDSLFLLSAQLYSNNFNIVLFKVSSYAALVYVMGGIASLLRFIC